MEPIADKSSAFQKFGACQGRGVYLLTYRGVVVYVGKSTCNVFARLGRHVRDKQFDAVRWAPIAEDENLDAIERELIRELRPAYNSMHK